MKRQSHTVFESLGPLSHSELLNANRKIRNRLPLPDQPADPALYLNSAEKWRIEAERIPTNTVISDQLAQRAQVSETVNRGE